MFYLYIIYSASANKYYVGHSVDPWKRLIEHNTSPFTSYTAKYRPWMLKAVFQCGTTKAEAMQIEKFVKKQKSRNLLEQLCDPSFIPTEYLAQLVIPHSAGRTCGINQRVVPHVRDSRSKPRNISGAL